MRWNPREVVFRGQDRGGNEGKRRAARTGGDRKHEDDRSLREPRRKGDMEMGKRRRCWSTSNRSHRGALSWRADDDVETGYGNEG